MGFKNITMSREWTFYRDRDGILIDYDIPIYNDSIGMEKLGLWVVPEHGGANRTIIELADTTPGGRKIIINLTPENRKYLIEALLEEQEKFD